MATHPVVIYGTHFGSNRENFPGNLSRLLITSPALRQSWSYIHVNGLKRCGISQTRFIPSIAFTLPLVHLLSPTQDFRRSDNHMKVLSKADLAWTFRRSETPHGERMYTQAFRYAVANGSYFITGRAFAGGRKDVGRRLFGETSRTSINIGLMHYSMYVAILSVFHT